MHPERLRRFNILESFLAHPNGTQAGSDSGIVRPLVTDPVARAGTQPRGTVVRIGEPTAVERQAAAADAFAEPGLQPLQFCNSCIDPCRPSARQTLPVVAGRRTVRRQFGEFGADLIERQADPLGKDNEGDPPQGCFRIAAMAGPGPLRPYQPALFIEAKRRSGDAASAGCVADCNHRAHPCRKADSAIDIKLTLTCILGICLEPLSTKPSHRKPAGAGASLGSPPAATFVPLPGRPRTWH